MKRIGRASASMSVIALLLTACGSDGPKTLSEDDFVDELNSICSDAARDIRRLDPEDRNYVEDVIEILQTGTDDLQKLKAPKDLEGDFKDFVDNLDDQGKEAEDFQQALDDEDADAIESSSENLAGLAEDGNDLADSLGADDCVDVNGGSTEGSVTTDSVPEATTPNTPLPIATTEETTAETTAETTEATTAPPITDAPATTSPTTAAPEMTIPPNSGDGLALDASLTFRPPAGHVWTPLADLASVGTPYGDPVVGPALVGYWAGLIENVETSQASLVFISEAAADWTPEQLEAILSFEGVGGQPNTATPGGLDARFFSGLGSENQFDVAVAILTNQTVSIIAAAGTDVFALIDALFLANTMGG